MQHNKLLQYLGVTHANNNSNDKKSDISGIGSSNSGSDNDSKTIKINQLKVDL
ncbi:MAG TPA: hypothetical protein VH500_16745 [Nitrososphaeraceae archaeon]